MALDDLLAAIEADAIAERRRTELAMDERSAAILAAGRRDAAGIAAEWARDSESAARAEADQIRSLARIDAAALIRNAREQAFQVLLDQLRERLASLRGTSRYPALFRGLVLESRDRLPTARVLHIDPRDAALAEQFAAELDIGVTLDCWGGLELSDNEGRTVRNTLEERLLNAELLLRRHFGQWLADIAADGPGKRP